MEILEASAMGMCFGVRDALAVAAGIEDPSGVVIHGELVHNPVVNRELARRGFGVETVQLTIEGRPNAEMQRGRGPQRRNGEERGTVMITAHGVSDKERERLAAEGKRVIDTTCPLVRRAHGVAMRLAREGHFVVVIGKAGHVEVRGLTGDLAAGEFAVVERAEEVRGFGRERIGVMCQTTSVGEEVREILAAIERENAGAEIRFVDTVCQPTKDRQAALEELLGKVDVMVVVGGRESNNTRKLVETCQKAGVRCIHVEGPGDLRSRDFSERARVGLTAGTSALGETVAAVRRRLEGMGSGNFQFSIFKW